MRQEYQDVLTLDNLLANFPRDKYPQILPNQEEALDIVAQHGSVRLEMPTGSGKTAVGYTVLKTLAEAGMGPLFYITPTKTLVDQVKQMHPDLTLAYGRHEYDCFYYEPEIFRADEIPCLSLLDCPHRVNQETGQTLVPGVKKCPYYQAKFQAKQSEIVVCSAAFYLFTTLFSREFPRPAGLVIDEAHQIANVLRNSLSYEITDWHLGRSVELLGRIDASKEAAGLEKFRQTMIRILRRKPQYPPKILEDEEIEELMAVLGKVNALKLREKVAKGIEKGEIDPTEDRQLLKRLEQVVYDLHRYVHTFEYALEGEDRHALNYVTYAYRTKEEQSDEKAQYRPVVKATQYRLIIKAHYVAPLVRKLLSPLTISYSATLGEPDVFGWESGIKSPYYSLPGTFPSENARVLLPTDTPNLATKVRIRAEPTKVLRRIAKECRRLGRNGHRSLVIVVSEKEREKFLWLCGEEHVKAVSYGNGTHPREAVRLFKDGEGTVLVGTVANYGEGVDLPEETVPVIFFLRPGYPRPNDPAAQFEQRRFGGGLWKVWNWRVMMEAQQVRGRNVRSPTDRGVTIFVSQQFRRFLYGSLPPWLQEAYNGELTLEEGLEEALELMK